MPYPITHENDKYYVNGHGYDTRQAALDYQRALYAHVPDEEKAADRPTSRDDYAYTPDDEPSHWKLPIQDEAHLSRAIDALSGDKNAPHGHGVDIPADARAGVVRKLSARINSLNVSDERKQELRDKLSPHRGKATDFFGGEALKALGNGKVGGYLVVFGGPKDAQGEYFQPNCEFHLDWFGGTTRPILYHHGLNDADTIEEIGTITNLVKDTHGLYAEGQLDMHNPRAQQVYAQVQRGKIGWSSGSSPHLSKVEPDGGIAEWAVVEASLTPTPAAGKRTTVRALKFDTRTFTPVHDDTALREPGTAKEAQTGMTKGERDRGLKRTNRKEPIMQIKMDTELIAALEKAGVSAEQIIEALKELGDGEEMAEPSDGMMADSDTDVTAAPVDEEPVKDAGPVTDGDGGADIHDTGAKPASNPPVQPKPGEGAGKALAKTAGTDAKTLAAAMQLMMASMKTAPAKSKGAGFMGDNPARTKARITDVHTPYHNLDAADMAYLYQLRASTKSPRHMPIEYQREMADKAMKAYNANKLDLAPDVARKVAMKLDFNNTTTAADGASWVPDLWSSLLWMRVRIDNNVAKNIEVFQMPSPTYEYPIESTDPTVYAVGESDIDAEMTLATNVFTRSKLAVTKLQFAAKKLGLQVGFSTEINEDSIIPFIPQLRAQATRAFANAIDNVILNSDSTTGTGNINYKGANTSAASTARWLFGGGDGMRKNALVTNTAVAKNFQGGLPTLGGIRALRFKMISSTNTYGINPENLCIITDPYTYGTFLAIDEINTFMNNGRNATVNTGVVPDIDGSPVYASAELALADSTGYAMNDGSGTLGNFVIFAKNAWKVGYVRQVMTDVSYVPWSDNYVLTMTARLAIGKKDTVASAVAYNILTTLA